MRGALEKASWIGKKVRNRIEYMKNPHAFDNNSSDDDSTDEGAGMMDQDGSRGGSGSRLHRFNQSSSSLPAGSARDAVRKLGRNGSRTTSDGRRVPASEDSADGAAAAAAGTPRKKSLRWSETLNVQPFDKLKPVVSQAEQRERITERIEETLWHGGVRVSGTQYMMRLRRLRPVATDDAAALLASKFAEREERIVHIERVATPKRFAAQKAIEELAMAGSSSPEASAAERVAAMATAASEALIDLYDPASTLELWMALSTNDLVGHLSPTSSERIFDRGPLSPGTSERLAAAIEVVPGPLASEKVLRVARPSEVVVTVDAAAPASPSTAAMGSSSSSSSQGGEGAQGGATKVVPHPQEADENSVVSSWSGGVRLPLASSGDHSQPTAFVSGQSRLCMMCMQVVVAEAKKKTAGDAAEAAEKKAGERRLRIVAVEPDSGLQGQLVLLRRAPLDAADEAVAAISDDAAAFDALLTTLLDADSLDALETECTLLLRRLCVEKWNDSALTPEQRSLRPRGAAGKPDPELRLRLVNGTTLRGTAMQKASLLLLAE